MVIFRSYVKLPEGTKRDWMWFSKFSRNDSDLSGWPTVTIFVMIFFFSVLGCIPKPYTLQI